MFHVDKTVVEKWLKEPVKEITEVEGGLFNTVFHARGDTHKIFVKHFADHAKDPSFPPLPTSSQERYQIAVAINSVADTIVMDFPIRSARIIGYDPHQCLVGIEAARGKPLYHLLLEKDTLDQARHIIMNVVAWMRKFHAESTHIMSTIYDSAECFKNYKTTMQYDAMLEYLPRTIHALVRTFIDTHRNNSTTVLLGDMNSRNIIVDFPQAKIIDFEQGQIGDKTHDLAYIVSELVIANMAADANPENDITTLWQTYLANTNDDDTSYSTYRKHLAFQTLYRLKGPSRAVWTGHLSQKIHDHITQWCINQFKALFSEATP